PAGDLDEGAVGQRDTDRLGLTPAHAVGVPEPTDPAGRLQARPAAVAPAAGPHERGDDEVTAADRRHLPADVLDEADELVPDRRAPVAGPARVVGVQVAAADARHDDTDQGVGGLDDGRVRDVLDTDVARAVDEGRPHTASRPAPRGARCGRYS